MTFLRATLLLFALPGTAFAATCEQIRPAWTPGTEATIWTEAIALFSTVPSLALLVASALAIRFRHQWGALIVVVLWAMWVSLVAMSSPDEAHLQAIAEGCIGSPTLFIVAVAAICGGMILYTAPLPKRTD